MRRPAAGRRSSRDQGSRSDGLAAIEQLARKIGIPSAETAWLEHSLTHRSYTREQGDEERESNERLEFLGDSVAQFVVSLALYARYPRWTEGQLTRARAAVVSREPMYRAALRMGLGEHLRLGKVEEEQGGRARASILSSAFEAVIAAVYLTSGMEVASDFVQKALQQEIDAVESTGDRSDFKTRLQEACQARFHVTPVYRLIDSSGPPHNRIFSVEVAVNDAVLGSGSGKSKKDAEQAAAEKALSALAK